MKNRQLSILLSVLLLFSSCRKTADPTDKPNAPGAVPAAQPSGGVPIITAENRAGICEVKEFPLPEDYAVSGEGIAYRDGIFSTDIVFFEDGSSYLTCQRKTMTFDAEGGQVQFSDADPDRIAVMETYALSRGLWFLDGALAVLDEDFLLTLVREGEEIAALDLPSAFGYDLREERRTNNFTGKSHAPFAVLDVTNSDGGFVILTTEGVCALDPEGRLLWTQDEMERPNAILPAGQGIWYLVNNCGAEQIFGKRELYLLDPADGSVLSSVELPEVIRNGQPMGSTARPMRLYPGDGTCAFYAATAIGLWGVTVEETKDGSLSAKAEERIDWLNSGVSPDSLMGLCIADEKTVAVLDGWGEDCRVLLLKKPDAPPKTGILTLASFCDNTGLNLYIHKAIERYNRSDSAYTVAVTDFTVYDKSMRTTFFNAEMAAGRVPDIVLMQTESAEDPTVFTYTHNGVFCDLVPLLKADDEFRYDDLLGYVTKPYQEDGAQRVCPLRPFTSTCFGSAEAFEGPVTAVEAVERIRSLPAGTSWSEYANEKDSILDGILNDFTNIGDASCSFDDGRFADILRALNDLPEQKIQRNGANRIYNPQLTFRSLAEGKIMLAEYEAWSLADYALMKQCAGSGIIAVGFPNEQRKLYVRNGGTVYFAVTEASGQKAEAVGFLKTVLSEFREADTNGSVYYADDVYEELSRYADKTVALDSLGIRLYDDSDLPATAVRTFKITKEDADEYISFLNSIDALLPTASTIYEIYSEECGSPLPRSPEDRARVIQSRVSVFLSERFG